MRNFVKAIFLGVVFSASVTLAEADAPKIQDIKIENAASDAQKALAQNDHRFMAVSTEEFAPMIVVPGVGDETQAVCGAKANGCIYIYGPHNGDTDPVAIQLDGNAKVYAAKYNLTILAAERKPKTH